MKLAFVFIIILIRCIVFSVNAQEIDGHTANLAARGWLSHYKGVTIINSDVLEGSHREIIGYLYHLSPDGYLVLTANRSLPPVIAYSFLSEFPLASQELNPLSDLLVQDIGSRLDHLGFLTHDVIERNREKWDALCNPASGKRGFEQWPPEGSTSTGGWLETNWKQSYPYNKFCPIDNVSGARSVAGCPAVALAMIIHYQKNLNNTQFSDGDDYYHSYAGRHYWIDDDATAWDFPSFPVLNEYFDTISTKFSTYTPLNQDEIASLIFGCGVAASQVYTSTVSGTFGVGQAYDAYLRFGYHGAELIYDSDTSFYPRMKNNIMDSKPVHLAVLSSTGQGGHNVVADGYNTDDYYHLNFGWGGSYNGWYLLPEEIPYNLTVVEGAVMDIGDMHVSLRDPFTIGSPGLSIFPNPAGNILHLRCPGCQTRDGTVEILGVDGKRLLVEHIGKGNESAKIGLAGLENGIYFCKITIGSEVSVKKIIKE